MLYEMNIASFSIKEVFSYIMVKRQRNWNNCMQNTIKFWDVPQTAMKN